jgi:hypothetical protein
VLKKWLSREKRTSAAKAALKIMALGGTAEAVPFRTQLFQHPLKPDFVGLCDVQAKAWTYLRSNGNGKDNCNGKSESRSSACGEG